MAGTFSTDSLVSPKESYIVLLNSTKRVNVEFKDLNDILYDPTSIKVTVYTPEGAVLETETYDDPAKSVITKEEVGKYYVNIDAAANQTTGDYQLVWEWKDASTDDWSMGLQQISIVSVQVIASFPYLRNQIDKALKDSTTEYGFNDTQLYMYLKGGLAEINRTPPITNLTFVTYPWQYHQQLLVDSATWYALTSQQILAIDTDSNYSMSGNSFAVDHFSKLSSVIATLAARIEVHIKKFKMDYLTTAGSVKAEIGMGFRSLAIWSASPKGTYYGNILGMR